MKLANHRAAFAGSAMLALLSGFIPGAAMASGEAVADIWLSTCNISDPQTLTSDQAACVGALTAALIGEDRAFLELSRVDFPAFVTHLHGCAGEHMLRVEPIWPIDDAGNPIALNVPRVVIEVLYTLLEDGSVSNADPYLIEPTASGFPDAPAFKAAAGWAVERWHFCESGEITHGTTRIVFQMDETIP